ncbi:sigma-54-dependent transcriptional regulator [Aquimarina sp. 2304DJ70-9]|uniref:sigma-54-dependent transcriptional regulator n=1 Tax=Aquimarina penaris TaxID=3231044 RepID=UPI0034629637
MTGKLLIVEDEFVIVQDLRNIISELGYAVMGHAKSAEEAMGKIKNEIPDLVLLDINIIGEETGIDLARKLEDTYQIPYIYITSYSDQDTISQMNTTNPLGYILKPFDERDIRVALEIGFAKLSRSKLSSSEVKSKSNGNNNETVIPIIGESEVLQKALKKVQQVARTDVTVLIHGETGTGKELFMNAVHQMSSRNHKKVVKVNCAALPTELIESVLFGHEKGSFTGATEKRLGKFELADGGTIFLDEIGELPLSSQSKLLRCLQEKEIETIGGNVLKKIDVRIIAATNRDLSKEVQEGNFRADLFFRLNIFPIHIPPLRKREDDIIILANHFLSRFTRQINKEVTSISADTLKVFMGYSWPGNVRELQHYVERGVILAEDNKLSIVIENDDRTHESAHQKEFQLKSLEEMEREQIIQTLQYCKGKIRGEGGAAEILKLHPNTLDFRIKKLGINKTKEYN